MNMKLTAQPDFASAHAPFPPTPREGGVGRDIQMLNVNNLITTPPTVQPSVCLSVPCRNAFYSYAYYLQSFFHKFFILPIFSSCQVLSDSTFNSRPPRRYSLRLGKPPHYFTKQLRPTQAPILSRMLFLAILYVYMCKRKTGIVFVPIVYYTFINEQYY